MSSVSLTPQQILLDTFGYAAFRPGQQEVIGAALQGRDSLVLMPTGGGKSICYQVPALAMGGLTLVVSPLISLMKDQVDSLNASGVRAIFFNAGMTREETLKGYADLQDGHYSLLYISPERLMQPAFFERLRHLPLSLIAIDEAHCVSHWGHDFRKEYRQLGQLKAHFPQIPVMALTATADLATRSDIQQQLQLSAPMVYCGGFDRPNIRYSLLTKYKPLEQILEFIARREGSGIIYCNSRKKVDELCQQLRQKGIKAAGYHAGMEAAAREQTQQAFLKDDVDIIVATVAFGMGINKPNVRFVVHHDLPRSIESYYQETGRAGRDGLPAEALLLFNERDISRIRQWIDTSDDASRRQIELEKFAAMEAFAEAQTCRRQVLLNYFADTHKDQCGNCDICLDPPKRFDGSTQAQQLLSCILRLQQQCAMQHVIDVFRGKQLRKIIEQGQDRLSTFGLGKDKPDAHWHNLLNQLIHQGLIRIDITQHSALKLTEKARRVLTGEQQVQLAVPRLNLKKKSTGVPENYDARLFAKLKHLRKRIAEEDDIPPYIVFNDVTLVEMASFMPEDETALLTISGVGQTKLERYGKRFLAAIEDHLVAG